MKMPRFGKTQIVAISKRDGRQGGLPGVWERRGGVLQHEGKVWRPAVQQVGLTSFLFNGNRKSPSQGCHVYT